ncbi:hypothetical protein BJ165DRAFT_652968 [Panaeolus papilionaceus]|nr:hypothetical protein BJ165DRAFT_652968 [Panaeolus papilionaceus]
MNLEDDEFSIHDPAVKSKKGRSRTSRITGPLEGRPRGGSLSQEEWPVRTGREVSELWSLQQNRSQPSHMPSANSG